MAVARPPRPLPLCSASPLCSARARSSRRRQGRAAWSRRRPPLPIRSRARLPLPPLSPADAASPQPCSPTDAAAPPPRSLPTPPLRLLWPPFWCGGGSFPSGDGGRLNSELGPSRFSVASVHRVGILDVCLLNIDRHADNILVKKSPESKCASGDSTPTPLDFLYGSGIAKSVSFSAAVPQPAPLPPHPAASSLAAGRLA
ncbi:uncharacterized protein [Oryza sativa Japonica Group]|uniref:uncharacterized protein n=1 Tax=Oryza sativa subsp. japonica TaxID=39947 RepID=UPI00339C3944